MKMTDNRKLSPEEQQQLRSQVVRLRQQGKSNREISETLGYCYSHISTIWKEFKEGVLDLDAPKPKVRGRRLGDKRKLNADQEARIINVLIDNSPAQLKLNHVSWLWTSKSIRLAIKQELGVEMPFRTISEYLKKWGFTPQKPTDRGSEQNKELSEHWLRTEYPEIVARIRKEKAEIHWFDYTEVKIGLGELSDKEGVSENYLIVDKSSINMISTISNRGKSRFVLFRKPMTPSDVQLFLGLLAKDCNRNIFLILYNNPVFHTMHLLHNRVENEEFSLRHGLKIIFRFLPSNLPEHNTDEFGRSAEPGKKLPWVRSNNRADG
jgi:transposase